MPTMQTGEVLGARAGQSPSHGDNLGELRNRKEPAWDEAWGRGQSGAETDLVQRRGLEFCSLPWEARRGGGAHPAGHAGAGWWGPGAHGTGLRVCWKASTTKS